MYVYGKTAHLNRIEQGKHFRYLVKIGFLLRFTYISPLVWNLLFLFDHNCISFLFMVLLNFIVVTFFNKRK